MFSDENCYRYQNIKIWKRNLLVNTTYIFDNYPIHIIWNYSPNNGELQVPIKRGSTIEITKDGIYEVSVSFIFQSVGGKRIWGNLMRKHKDSRTQNIKGNICNFLNLVSNTDFDPDHSLEIVHLILFFCCRKSIDLCFYWY